MKTTRFDTIDVGSTSGSGGATGPAGGDAGGSFPNPTVTGIQGTPVCITAPVLDQVLQFDGTQWCPATLPPSGLSSITDGITTITPVTDLTVPPHSLSGATPAATLAYVTPTYGGQETLHTVAASSTAQTISPSAANVHDLTLTANCTITLGAATSGKACAITVILRQDATGSRTVTWPGSVSWLTGSPPTLRTAAAAVDVIVLFTEDGGTTWGGVAVGAGFSGGTPALTLGTTNAPGSATTGIRTDATIAVFDATVPVTQALGDAAATGSAVAAARRDHKHGMPALSTATPLVESGTGAVGTGTKSSREDHVHPVSSAGTGVGTYGLLVQDGATSPPVTLYTEDGTDWLYADG